MEQVHKINLEYYVDPPHTDWISGRKFGEDKALEEKLIELIDKRQKVEIVINSEKVKAINDSFIKGFFNKVFEKLKTKKAVEELFSVKGDDFFVRLFDKNFRILDALYNNGLTS